MWSHTPSPGGRAGDGAGTAHGPEETALAPGIAHRCGPVPAGPRQLHGAADGPGREPERPQPPPAGRTPSRQKVRPVPFPGVAGVSLAPKPSTICTVGSRQSGHVWGSLGLPVAGVGTPARRRVVWQPRHHGCAQARLHVPHRRPQGGPLVACDHLAPEGLCSRHSVHKFTRDPDLKVRLVTFWTLSVPAAAGACKHGRGVWCPVMGMASKELLGCWPGDPARGFQVDWVLEGHRGRGGHAREAAGGAEITSRSTLQGLCQCLGGSCRPRARSCDAGLQGRTLAQRHLCQL